MEVSLNTESLPSTSEEQAASTSYQVNDNEQPQQPCSQNPLHSDSSTTEDSTSMSKENAVRGPVKKRITQSQKRGKKRQLDSTTWIDVKSKIARQSGLGGIGRKGVEIKERKMGPGCTQKCPKKCHLNFSEEDRKYAKDIFWGLQSHSKQWQCLINWVQKKVKEEGSTSPTSSPNKTKKHNHAMSRYSLPKRNTAERVIVCQTMFLDTLSK